MLFGRSRYLFMLLLLFILGAFSWCTLYDRCEFIFTSVFLFFGFDRSSFIWMLMYFHSSVFFDTLEGVIRFMALLESALLALGSG